jgi:Rad3-related DNA helicase
MKPIDFGLEHDEFRPGQEQAIMWGFGIDKVGALEAPTGSGKTPIATAMANHFGKSVALTRTKVLQMDNYEGSYGFKAVYGKSNYECAYNGNVQCDECAFQKNMKKCPVYSSCHYVNAREVAKVSQFASLNYSYWLLMRKKWPNPDLVICDEAHQLPEIVLDHAGIEITPHQKEQWDLPSFPAIFGKKKSISLNGSNSNGDEERAIKWLEDCLTHMRIIHARLQIDSPFNTDAMKTANRCERMVKKIESTINALRSNPNDWFIRSGPKAVNGGWGFIAKPLTAKHHFREYFLGEWKNLLMSATLGNIPVFCQNLGIENYESHIVPPIFPKERQPVYSLDVPKMGWNSNDLKRDKQADEISRFIKIYPNEWPGIIHTSSYFQTDDLIRRLHKRGLENRIFACQSRGTNNQMREWHDRLRKVTNSLLISPTFSEGYDGKQEKINICAKVPYPSTSSDYEKARKLYNEKEYLWRTASRIQQQSGRNRRGNEEDYDTDNEVRTANAIADGMWSHVQKYFSPHFRECIVKA